MPLDPIPLAYVTCRLREELRRYERETVDEQVRDGLILRLNSRTTSPAAG